MNSQVTAAAALYYAMLLMSRAGTGTLMSTSVSSGGLNVFAHSLQLADGSTIVIIVNNNANTGFDAKINVGTTVTSGLAVYLRGPSLAATTGTTSAAAAPTSRRSSDCAAPRASANMARTGHGRISVQARFSVDHPLCVGGSPSMTRRLSASALVTAFVLGSVACGGGNSGSTEATESGAPNGGGSGSVAAFDAASPTMGDSSSPPVDDDAGGSGSGTDAASGSGTGSDASSPPPVGAGLWSNVSNSGPPAFSGSTVNVDVTVTPGNPVGQLGQGFVGLSYEKSHMTDQFFTGTNAPLIALCKLLGPSVVRIGGNSVDRTTWQPTAPAAAVSALSSSIGTADVDGLASFLQASGWKVVYGLNLKTSTAQLAAAEATYAAAHIGSNVEAFEIGNEPDLYGTTYAAWSAKWDSFGSAIQSSVPKAPLAGPATAGGGVSAAVNLAHDEASRLTLLTQHYYRGTGKTTAATSVTMASLVSPDPGLISVLKQLSGAVTSNKTPDGFRLAEANSYFAHGAPGVSDAFGSALWAIDFLFDNAENGSSGVNFHGGGAGQDGSGPFIYTPINEAAGVVTGAQPIFYGMLLVTSAGPGPVLETAVGNTSLNFTAYAVSVSDGSTNVVLVNKDGTNGVKASVSMGKSASTAAAVFLDGASLLATSGVTFAGAPISPAGAWTPTPAWTVPVSGEVVSIVVPPASAALVHVD